ncbi:PTS sugar transporter subunit IIA [Lacticaseibacillus thailandensis]|uniref:Uncharacterized protein n=1 Tax=Lacticaseibacillus thailandensis DSM 22698 = JCM 13996 TaxID=1423810 RepID=A0A0R2C5P0_9LACO|nr:PTS sugar transporter subunit IIA [Lacticaseibacillus thailandensis]KRM87183.1 hypothetical protein FD19_GL001337 [Lacticaseibacillus thailandensis DSM 22698 = JCM 13996]
MLSLLKKKNVVANVALDENNELAALKAIANRVAGKLDLAEQELKSGFFASGAQDAVIIGDEAVILRATSSTLTHPEAVVLSFDSPVQWGDDNSSVDIAIAIVLPVNDDSAYQTLLNNARVAISDHIDELNTLKSSNSGLKTLWKEINR